MKDLKLSALNFIDRERGSRFVVWINLEVGKMCIRISSFSIYL
jgi:hypothetical protein